MSPRFRLGKVVATPGALEVLSDAEVDVFHLVLRHSKGDWGDIGPEDKAANDRDAVAGGRLLSSYELRTGDRVWVITEADRSSTCVLLPDEY